MFEPHDLGQWLHGPCLAQAQAASPRYLQPQPLSQTFPRGQSHMHHPDPGEILCLLLLSSILFLCIVLILSPNQWLLNTDVFVASCFPTFSSFVLISSDMCVSQFCFACWTRKTIFLNPVKQLYIFSSVQINLFFISPFVTI